MATLNRGTLFDPVLIPGLIENIRGKSSLAVLSKSTPIAFNGQREFTFTMGSEANLVAESAAKAPGTIGVTSRVIMPLKIEYGARVSEEFLFGSEDLRLDILSAFSEGFAKKAARALDIMALHGMNPRTATASSIIGDNHFDVGTQAVYEGTDESAENSNDLVEAAIGLVGANDWDVTGIAMSPAFRTKLSKLTLGTDNRQPRFPELAWGRAPGFINGLPIDVNSTMHFGESNDLALLGDFENCFKWGYAKEIPMRVIEYGTPDNDAEAGDLAGHNEVYIRCELYLGWGILDKGAFALIKSGAAPSEP